jgi:hypothetical protein
MFILNLNGIFVPMIGFIWIPFFAVLAKMDLKYFLMNAVIYRIVFLQNNYYTGVEC